MAAPSRKRMRVVLSCTECHRRKQKCDRQSPCSTCIQRDRQNQCHYESLQEKILSEPDTSGRIDSSENSTLGISGPSSSTVSWPGHVDHRFKTRLLDSGYASRDDCNSLSLLNATERHEANSTSRSLVATALGCERAVQFRQDEQRRYLELIRRLPPPEPTNVLLQTYFTSTNWEYDLLDHNIFQAQYEAWKNVSYADLQGDLRTLAIGLFGFPSLLFQVLAHALLVQSSSNTKVKGLLPIAGMTFHDLAREYSDAGADVLVLVGKRALTTATVQAGVLRTAVLKSMGEVVDAWHALGATIRDAQEIGLHTRQTELEESFGTPAVGKQALSDTGKKLWLILHIWDAHMAVVLGRPMATELRLERFVRYTTDCERRRDLFEHWRSEDEPPRPWDIIMAGYYAAYRFLPDIHHLQHHETDCSCTRTVESVHAAIVQNMATLPSWCRLQNPSTRFDTPYGSQQWLPAARQTLYTLVHFVLLALHRPYIFTEPKSRMTAIEAGSTILQAQERAFQDSELQTCNLFTPVYTTFDAIVVMAAIYIACPAERDQARGQHLKELAQAIYRLGMIGRTIRIASSAHAVAVNLYQRLQSRLGRAGNPGAPKGTVDSLGAAPGSGSGSSSLPIGIDMSFEAVSPPQPLHDLFYEHLSSSAQGDYSHTSVEDLLTDLEGGFTHAWNFEGAFSDSSFWTALNAVDSNI